MSMLHELVRPFTYAFEKAHITEEDVAPTFDLLLLLLNSLV